MVPKDSPLTRLGFVVALLLGVRPQRSAARDSRDWTAEPTGATCPMGAPWAFVNLAAQDWLVLLYLGFLFTQCLTGTGERRIPALRALLLDLGVWVAVLSLTRSRMLIAYPRLVSVLYRIGIGFPIFVSFLQLQYILPAAGRPVLDAQLLAFDLHVFGVEPALAWDRFVTPATTEWFAFFYYGYFFLIAIHVLPMLAFVKSSPFLARFSFGFLWLYCIGQAFYTLVPAFGPYAHLAQDFQHPLEGAFWWPLVRSVVSSVDGAARTDVFPSLHTALPTYLSLFSFLERRRWPFRFTWLPLALFTTQIIAATMFLRWHYLVDIVAGVTLAVSAIFASRLALGWDAARERLGGRPVWPTAPVR